MKNLEFMYFRPKMDMMKFKPIFQASFPAGTSAIKAVKVLFYKSVLLVTLAFTQSAVQPAFHARPIESDSPQVKESGSQTVTGETQQTQRTLDGCFHIVSILFQYCCHTGSMQFLYCSHLISIFFHVVFILFLCCSHVVFIMFPYYFHVVSILFLCCFHIVILN